MEDILVFGVPLDPDEREEVVRRKHDVTKRSALDYTDPYSALCSKFSFNKKLLGNFPVESWLTPIPNEEELFMCTVENYVGFIDCDGCWEYTMAIKKYLDESANNKRSLMVAVDHSVAAASIMHSCEQYGKEDCGIVVFDSHFDGILPSYRCGLIQYDLDTNPSSNFDKNDPFIFGRSESFNADSFLFKLIDDGLVEPNNIIVAGVSDYPSNKTAKIKDERVEKFVEFYRHYEDIGVTIIPKEKIKANPRAFDISSLDCSSLHVSVDVDVGSRNALYGARFIDYKGLSSPEIFYMLDKVLQSKKKIVSADISEIDVWRANRKHFGKQDNTYTIASRIGNKLFS
ncbi:MAG: arginase family protein [Candidatus Methanofastidiosia archaeon]